MNEEANQETASTQAEETQTTTEVQRWHKGMASPNPKGRPPMVRSVRDVRDLARTHTTAAIETLAKVMQNPKSPPACRVAASEALLGRAWGRVPTTELEGAEQLVIKVIRMADHIEEPKVIEHDDGAE
jgi:hypothetical protein